MQFWGYCYRCSTRGLTYARAYYYGRHANASMKPARVKGKEGMNMKWHIYEAYVDPPGCAVATVSPVAALWETSMNPDCFGFLSVPRFF